MGTLNIDRSMPQWERVLQRRRPLHKCALSEAQRCSSDAAKAFVCTLPGHERLVRLLIDSQIDRPRLRFLEQDRAA